MIAKPQAIVIPMCGDFDSALKYISLLTPDLSNLEIIVVYAIASSRIFGANRRRNRTKISMQILQAIEIDIVSTVDAKIRGLLPDILHEQIKYKFEIGSWGDAVQNVVKNEKCDLLLLGYEEEGIIDRLFGGLYSTAFRVSSITTLVVKIP